MKIFKLLFAAFVLTLSSCEKKDPEIPNEEEVITTLIYTLTPSGGGTAVEMKFQDLDGDGGDAPTITTGKLMKNTTYNGTLVLMNELVTPTEDITEELKEEDKDHQFFFSSTISDLLVSYTDQDAEGNPIGLETTLTSTNAGSGNLSITLKHKPNKTASGVSTGDISNAGGETDIEITFSIDVE